MASMGDGPSGMHNQRKGAGKAGHKGTMGKGGGSPGRAKGTMGTGKKGGGSKGVMGRKGSDRGY